MRLVNVCCLLSIVMLASCRYYNVNEEHGRFESVDHMREDLWKWELGGRMQTVSRSLCNRVSGVCYLDNNSRNLRTRYAVSPGRDMIAVYANNADGRREVGSVFSIFRTANGLEVPCDGDMVSGANSIYRFGSVFWVRKDRLILLFERHASSGAIGVSYMIDVSDGVCRSILLDEFHVDPLNTVFTRRPSVDEQGEVVAWIACQEACDLVVRDLKDGEVSVSLATCPRNKTPAVAWEEGAPRVRCD